MQHRPNLLTNASKSIVLDLVMVEGEEQVLYEAGEPGSNIQEVSERTMRETAAATTPMVVPEVMAEYFAT